MSEQSLTGRHYLSGRTVEVCWSDGLITSVTPQDDGPADHWLAPGLVDVQINGYAGVDFQKDDVSEEDLLKAADGLHRDGCGRWMLTLITAEWSVLLARLGHLRRVRANSEALQKRIVGWHVEGPFLSAEPGFKGAHDASVMTDPTCAQIDELKKVLGDDPILLTLAAERPGAIEVTRHAVSQGIAVSIGHSNASAENLRDAVEAGATGFTHLSNGMPQQMDRHDNIVSRVVDTDRLVVGLIPDAIHVAPQMFRLLHKALPADLIYYTTDAMSAGGAPPGRYWLGPHELEVGEDKIVHIPGQTNFAGSALSPVEGIKRSAEMLGRSWRDVWDFFSLNAAQLVGVKAGLEPGCPADICEVVGDEQTAKSIKHVVG